MERYSMDESINGNCLEMLARMLEKGVITPREDSTLLFLHEPECQHDTIAGTCTCCPTIVYRGVQYNYFDIMSEGRVH
jgi:hypothetical protein